MCLFKRKKFYNIVYKDNWGDYGAATILASSKVNAWKKLKKQYVKRSPYQACFCISIKEMGGGRII